ncbi:hypothetical protein G6F53_014114 [Rhizopus delemar]|nr:hypothetical protein G6F53_014114 [Rhizopus delemar]
MVLDAVCPSTSDCVMVPLTTKGCSPLMDTHQPGTTAMPPENIMPHSTRCHQTGRVEGSSPRRKVHTNVTQATASISRPNPTATRNDQKVNATGGSMPEYLSRPW